MKKLKVIMIDAFKPSYLAHAPYLRSLTQKNRWGELDMGIGHWRGVEVLFKGESHTIANFYKNKEKSLEYLRYFTWLKYFGMGGRFIVNVLFNFPRWLQGYELFKTGVIPLSRLWQFDVSVKKHIAKKHYFVYFGALDSLGHQYGTESSEVRNAIQKIDTAISKMNFDLIFSDHGMIDIERVISVPMTKDCFIDSDMARYWGEKEELERIKKELPLDSGKIIAWDKRFGDLIFLANSGTLIFPNFWNQKIVKAMHGYDGKHLEMKAFYLLNKRGDRNDINALGLHELLKKEGYL